MSNIRLSRIHLTYFLECKACADTEMFTGGGDAGGGGRVWGLFSVNLLREFNKV